MIRSTGSHFFYLEVILTMTNVKELFRGEESKACLPLLKLAGEIASSLDVEAYVVGGFVRDLMMGRPLNDIDIMVVGDGIAYAKKVSLALGIGKVVPFEKFGTAIIPSQPIQIEIASARTEKYDDHSRKPSQIKYTDLKGDLVRRDFTINAMAVDIRPDYFGELHDPFEGILDLSAQRLVTPLDPDDTFSEDPLRMMRAAYFASKLGFNMDLECFESIQRQAKRIEIVSWERKTTELQKILKTTKPSIGLNILQKTGLMEYVFPEIDNMVGLDQTSEWHHKDIYTHTMQVVDNAAILTDKMEIRFAALVHDIAKPHTRRIDPKKGYTFHGHSEVGARILIKVAKRMKLSNELRDYLVNLTLLHLRPIALVKGEVTDSAVRRVMVAAGDRIDDLLILCRADITTKNPNKVKRYLNNFQIVESKMANVHERDAMRAFQSPIRGKEIMDICGLTEGKVVGKIKMTIEEAILDGEIENTYQDAKSFLLKNKKSLLDNN